MHVLRHFLQCALRHNMYMKTSVRACAPAYKLTHNHHPISIDQELHAMLIIPSLHSTQPNQTSFAAKSRAISIRVSCSVIADVQHVDNSSTRTTFVRSTFGVAQGNVYVFMF